MRLAVKFIYAKSYDFYDQSDKHVVGTNAWCFDPYSNQILKCKVVNPAFIEGLQFGDDLEVSCIPNGQFIKYEI